MTSVIAQRDSHWSRARLLMNDEKMGRFWHIILRAKKMRQRGQTCDAANVQPAALYTLAVRTEIPCRVAIAEGSHERHQFDMCLPDPHFSMYKSLTGPRQKMIQLRRLSAPGECLKLTFKIACT